MFDSMALTEHLLTQLAYQLVLVSSNSLTKKGNFRRKLLVSLRGEFFVQFLLALPWCLTVNISPYCLKKIIEYMECQGCGPPTIHQYLYVFGILFASLGGAISQQQATQCGRHMYIHAASVANSEVYAKALRRKDKSSPKEQQDQGHRSANVASKLILFLFSMKCHFSKHTELTEIKLFNC